MVRIATTTIGLAFVLVSTARAETVVYSATGATPGDIQSTVDAFRTAVGPLNGNVPGTFGGGRREINWDAVPDAFASPNAFPGGFFNFTTAPRARGASFTTPGDHFEVSAKLGNPTSTPVEFGNIDPAYTDEFAVFSAERLFAPIASDETEASFFVPGTVTVPAAVKAFGAVFSDVEAADASGIELYDADNNLLAVAYAPAADANTSGTLSFVGVLLTGPERIAKVIVRNGTLPLGPTNLDNGRDDVVAMDDFIYGEPISLDCPTDLNGDGQTDGADLGLFLVNWGPNPGHVTDFDGDGSINGADLGFLLNYWGPCN